MSHDALNIKIIEKLDNILEIMQEYFLKDIDINKCQELVINDIVIISRPRDHYINAIQLCKAGDKEFNDWVSNTAAKELVSCLSLKAGIPAFKLIDVKQGGNYSGSWIHPDLAIQLAQWISPSFALQVSGWVRKIFSVTRQNKRTKVLEKKTLQPKDNDDEMDRVSKERMEFLKNLEADFNEDLS